ncbi:MAG: hypothetical protein K6E53_14330 [Lachnospiraceae bacterium]|nr:hypothetical protein [Lachnospiraceae bacterium]
MFSILSEREYRSWPSWQVIYEWEDVFADVWSCPVIRIKRGAGADIFDRLTERLGISRLISRREYGTAGESLSLLFVMEADKYYRLPVRDVIPVFLDFPLNMADTISRVTRNIPVFFVTCMDIYRVLLNKGVNNVKYIPLSVSDIYYSEKVPEKTVDVVQVGRKDPLLHGYMLDYCSVHTEVEYIYQTDNGTLEYNSTTRGNLGRFEKRSDYMELLKASRISLVSSPGCDRDKVKRFGNIDFITPRFYESAVMYCRMIGRYSENAEAEETGLNRVCVNVSDKDEFNGYIDRYLNNEARDWGPQREFIKNNLTGVRAGKMKKILEDLSAYNRQ